MIATRPDKAFLHLAGEFGPEIGPLARTFQEKL